MLPCLAHTAKKLKSITKPSTPITIAAISNQDMHHYGTSIKFFSFSEEEMHPGSTPDPWGQLADEREGLSYEKDFVWAIFDLLSHV